jgi:hypothetical protein
MYDCQLLCVNPRCRFLSDAIKLYMLLVFVLFVNGNVFFSFVGVVVCNTF